MTEYLVELYRERTQVQAAAEDGERARAAAELLAGSGTPVRLIRSIFVPEDETCFLLFDSPSASAVRAVLTLARLPCTEVHPTAGVTHPNLSTKGSP